MGQEVTINGSADPQARYVTFAPSPCTIRQTGRRSPHLDVVLSSRPARQGGGEVVFYPPEGGGPGEQLRLRLPTNGTPVAFAIAGRYQRPSIEDGDCLLVVTPVDGGEPETTIPLMVRVRKNANELTTAERDRFLAALGRLNDGGRGIYADFRAMHVSAANSQQHQGPQFLPWHRAYLLDLERELQNIDPSVSLHYWRWDVASPNVFQRNFMGVTGLDGYVEFAPNHALNGWVTDGQIGILRRPRFVTELPAPLPINQMLTLAYGDKYPEFAQMEGQPHGWAHVSFDGWINAIQTAAKDPLFFMLHSNVDRLWALWQWLNRRTDPVQPATYTGQDQDGRRLGDTLWPWNGEQDRVRPPFAPGGTFPPSALLPAPGDVPLLRSMIDFQGHTDPIDRLGFGYDTVPFEFGAPEAIVSIEDVRRKIEADIARELERAREPVLDAATGDVAAAQALAAAGIAHHSDVQRAREALDSPDALPELRAVALRIVTDAHPDPATAHELALERVTDASQPHEVRMAALDVLRVQAIASPTFAEWRPDYLQAMRAASRDEVPAIRRAALEVLASHQDPYAAEVLLAGLRDPGAALVPPEEALQLLGYDIHEEVYEIAEAIAEQPRNPRARYEALRLLASVPAQADRFEALFGDPGEELRVRRLAATALGALAPDRLRSAAARVFPDLGAPLADLGGVAGDETEALRQHTASLLDL